MEPIEPNCSKRKCKYYLGVKEKLGGGEKTFIHTCWAFLEGILDEIAYGDNLHLDPLKGQLNTIVFEKEEEEKEPSLSTHRGSPSLN